MTLGELGLEKTSEQGGNKVGWSYSSPDQFWELKGPEICRTQVKPPLNLRAEFCSWLSVVGAFLPEMGQSCPHAAQAMCLILPTWPLGSRFKSPQMLALLCFPSQGFISSTHNSSTWV